MKTIYLKNLNKDELINDISSILEGYTGEIEFSNGLIFCHFIGMIPKLMNKDTGEVLEWEEGYYANILCENDFTYVFSSEILNPINPFHSFWI